ncbi:polypeptide N-acetylgalactosaminyltransferase 6-like isoform X2 [Brachyhypopomus gauderio]|uniref:polypeptide N-acetylgalactosaminyltransferase 6-like isoform X2 n=1 Tax=Brachyhypopomus gauderio TaxID=698409 RepID=UPI004043246B
MRVRFHRLRLLFMFLLVALSIFLTLLYMQQKNRQSLNHLGQDLHALPLKAPRSSGNNVPFKNRGLLPPLPDISAGRADVSCPYGFYSPEDLWPHLARPPEKPEGPGANGRAFVMDKLSPAELIEKEKGMAATGFNQFASDRISLHRSLGNDTRHTECVERRFSRCPPLPDTSVIIVFHNEAWSTLLRTIYSVLHTSPALLLREIILVDDASTHDHLKAPLEMHVELLKVVRVVRQKQRKGLVPARLLGAREAQGQVLTFLDSHCECFDGWLEPLLVQLVKEPRAVVSPEIAVIDPNTLKFAKPIPGDRPRNRGSFDWALNFAWESVPVQEKLIYKDETYPVKTPVFAGGLFSIYKDFFEHIGSYDDQMEIWGGENIEMSFRVRAAEVWMDDYKNIFYRRNKKAADIAHNKSYGDILHRLELRKSLDCKNFSWYLENVYPEAFVPELLPAQFGSLKNLGSSTCLDIGEKRPIRKPVILYTCHYMGGNQHFEYTSQQELQHNTALQLCLHATIEPEPVRIELCSTKGPGKATAPQQEWTLSLLSAEYYLLLSKVFNKCLTVEGGKAIMKNCNPADKYQHWVFR